MVVPLPSPEEAAAVVIMSSQQEPLWCLVGNTPLLVQPPPLEPDLQLVPLQMPLMVPLQEPLMVPPLAMAPPMLAYALAC